MMRGANRRHQSGAAPALLRSGDLSVVAPPVPIPNTEVKRCSPDGSTAIGRARVGRRQNKNPGEFYHRGFCVVPTPTRAENTATRGVGERVGETRVNRTSPEPGPLLRKQIATSSMWSATFFIDAITNRSHTSSARRCGRYCLGIC